MAFSGFSIPFGAVFFRAVFVWAGEVEEVAQGNSQLERRPVEESQPVRVGRTGCGILEQDLDEPEDAEQGIRHVVRDVGRQVAERGRAGEGHEVAFRRRPLAARQSVYR